MDSKLILKKILLLFVGVFIVTTFIIYIHTPIPPPLIFDYKCLDTQQICPVKIDEDRKAALENSIKNAVKDSHRLGKLSEVYISLMRFQVNVLNLSVGYVTVGSTTTQKINGDIECVDGLLSYGTEKEIEGYFVLSDSTNDLVNSVTSYVNKCPGFIINKTSLNNLPLVPPNSTVIFDFGPQFIPRFYPDLWSWTLVFVFNLLIFFGLIPLVREGGRFLRKGSDYFT